MHYAKDTITYDKFVESLCTFLATSEMYGAVDVGRIAARAKELYEDTTLALLICEWAHKANHRERDRFQMCLAATAGVGDCVDSFGWEYYDNDLAVLEDIITDLL